MSVRKRKKRKRQVRFVVILSTFTLLFITTGYAAISTNITLKAKGNILSSGKTANEIKNSVTSEDGLYQDTTETDRYIYKGANPKNYISFNNEIWRIYSIESDGSIKIIRNELLESRAFDSIISNSRLSSGYCSQGYAPSYGCNAWAATANLVGTPSEFTNGSSTGKVSADSQILTYLNENYYNELSDETQNKTISHSWNVGPSGTYNDEYTLSQLVSSDYETKYQWKGKIAMLTKSEYMRASSNSSCVTAKYWYDTSSSKTCSSTNYLYNSSTDWYFLSPYSGGTRGVFGASHGGFVESYYASESYGVRPAVYLCSGLKLSGEGTNDSNIYTISGSCS